MPWIFHSFINFSKPSKFHPSWPPYFQPVTTFLILNCEHWREDPRHMMWAFSFNLSWKWKLLSCVQLLVTPWTICSWNFPGQNTGVGSLFLLQGIFPQPRDWTQVSRIAGGFFTSWVITFNFTFSPTLSAILNYISIYSLSVFLLSSLVSVDEIVLLFKTNHFICVHDLEPLIIHFLCIFSVSLSMATFPSVCKYHCLCHPLPCIISSFSLKISQFLSCLPSVCSLSPNRFLQIITYTLYFNSTTYNNNSVHSLKACF